MALIFMVFRFLIFLVIPICGLSQSITVRHYGVQEGLPSSEVYDIFQDSQGFLWFSTDNGVVRFDGYKLALYNVSDNLPDPVVFETLEDPSGKVWFRTFSGKIASFENGAIKPYPFNAVLSKECEKQYLYSMAFDRTGTLWFTSGGVCGYIDTTGTVTYDKPDRNQFYFKTIENSWVIRSSTASRDVGSLQLDDKKFPIQLSRDYLDLRTSHPVMRSVRWNGNQYLNVNNNIFKYDGNTVTRVYDGHSAIISLSLDRDNNLWVGFFNGGVIRFSNDTFNERWSPEFMEKKSVTKVVQDHEGGLWISTLESGVYSIPNSEIKHYTLTTDSKIKTVFSSNTITYIGETNGTLSTINIKDRQLVDRKMYERAILSVFENGTTRWVSMAGGIYIYDKQTGQLKTPFLSNFVDFTQDAQGYVYAVESSGVSKFDKTGNLLWNKQKRSPHRVILCVDSTLIIGLHTGVHVYDLELNELHTPEKLKDYKISDLFRLNDSTLIIATVGNGFYVVDNRFTKFESYKTPAQNIYSIVKTDDVIWMGTERGLLKISERELLSKQPDYEFLTYNSGLFSNPISLLSKTSSGEILIFHDNTYSILQANSKRSSNKNPKFYLTSLNINSTKADFANSIRLPYDSNNIQMNFGFLSFNNQDIKTRYRLRAKDAWIYTNDRTINFFSLSPDVYTPELQYSTDNSTWMGVLLPTLDIRPPWWRNIYIQIGLLLPFIGIIVLLLNNRVVIYRQRNERMELMNKHQKMLIKTELDTLERERTRIARDLHDSVSPTIIAANLTLKNSIRKNEAVKLELVEYEFEVALREIKNLVYDLEPPELRKFGLVASLRNYVERLSKASQIEIDVTSDGQDLKDSKMTRMAFRILQELIANSLKHSGADKILIDLAASNSIFKITFTDNGTGFTRKEESTGLGLNNIESRILALNGKIRFESGNFGVFYRIEFPFT